MQAAIVANLDSASCTVGHWDEHRSTSRPVVLTIRPFDLVTLLPQFLCLLLSEAIDLHPLMHGGLLQFSSVRLHLIVHSVRSLSFCCVVS